jgi:hypothetical protein
MEGLLKKRVLSHSGPSKELMVKSVETECRCCSRAYQCVVGHRRRWYILQNVERLLVDDLSGRRKFGSCHTPNGSENPNSEQSNSGRHGEKGNEWWWVWEEKI